MSGYDPADDSRKSYDVCIAAMGEKLRSFRREQIGDATLYLGDCREVLPVICAGAHTAGVGALSEAGWEVTHTIGFPFSAVVTDPPYGIGYTSGWATDRLWAAGRKITNDGDATVRDEALQMLNCAMLVFGSRKVAPPPRTRQVLIWDKQGALGMGALDLPWKPAHEEIYVIGKGFVGGRNSHSVISHPPTQAMACNGRTHPNEKPVGLIEMLLGWCPAGVVLDPFMGSGTTGVACAKTGRAFVGIEVEPKFFDIACKRIDEAYRQPRLFKDEAPKPKQEALL